MCIDKILTYFFFYHLGVSYNNFVMTNHKHNQKKPITYKNSFNVIGSASGRLALLFDIF